MLFLDALGASLVALLMTKRGLAMILGGLSALLDQPPTGAMAQAIRSIVTNTIPENAVLGMRMRKGGSLLFVEVAVDEAAFSTVRHITERTETIRRALREIESPVDLTLVISRPANPQ